MALGDEIRRNIADVDPSNKALLRNAFLELNRRFFPGARTDSPLPAGDVVVQTRRNPLGNAYAQHFRIRAVAPRTREQAGRDIAAGQPVIVSALLGLDKRSQEHPQRQPRRRNELPISRSFIFLLSSIVLWLIAANSFAATPPPLPGPNWQITGSLQDPQIAAGKSNVIVSGYDTIYVYDKSGQPITTDFNGNPLETSVTNIFRPLWDPNTPNNINDQLALPSGTSCDRKIPFKKVQNDGTTRNYCLSIYYDARLLYDEYRDRFIIVASAINQSAQCGNNPNPILNARRSKLLVAYSRSGDLRDGAGWNVSWFDAVPGEKECGANSMCSTNNMYQPGWGAEYPLLGMTPDYLMIAITVGQRTNAMGCASSAQKRTWTLRMISLKALATNTWSLATCGFGLCTVVYRGDTDILDSNNKPLPQDPKLFPARTHGGAAFENRAWFAQAAGGSRINLWGAPGLAGQFGKPPLERWAAILPADGVVDTSTGGTTYPQPGAKPPLPSSTVMLDQTGDLVATNGKLYVAASGFKKYPNGTQADQVIQLMELAWISGGSGTFIPQRYTIIGGANVGVGGAALEVTAKGTMTLLYRWIDAKNSLTAQYFTWYKKDLTGASRALASGSGVANRCTITNQIFACDTVGKADTAGIARDPTSDPNGRVYMIEPFISSGVFHSAINYIAPDGISATPCPPLCN